MSKRHSELGLFLVVLFACSVIAEQPPSLSAQQDPSLKRFLQSYVGKLSLVDEDAEDPTLYFAAFAHLSGRAEPEVIVYLSGDGWCGSGGCIALILVPTGKSYKVITKTTITDLPIRILPTKKNGWRDIGVFVAGGGIHPGHTAKLSFNGRKYPSNPSISAAVPIHGTVEGTIVIPEDAKGMPLYK